MPRRRHARWTDKQRITDCLIRAKGNRRKAAELAGYTPKSLNFRITGLGLREKANEIKRHFAIVDAMAALVKSKGNKQKAAKILGISERNFHYRIRAYRGMVNAFVKELKHIEWSRERAELLDLYLRSGRMFPAAAAAAGISEQAMHKKLESHGILDLMEQLDAFVVEREKAKEVKKALARVRRKFKKPIELEPKEWAAFQREICGFLPASLGLSAKEKTLSNALNYWLTTFMQRARSSLIRRGLREAHPDRGGSAKQFIAVKKQADRFENTVASVREAAGWPSINVHRRAEKSLGKKRVGSVVSIEGFTFIKTSRGPVLFAEKK